VPYIAAWSAERENDVVGDGFVLRVNAFTGQTQLRYRDEHLTDRDSHGVLWHRVAWSPGIGRPAFADVHTVRQRRAMNHALCQICGSNKGDLWLTPALLWDAHLAENGHSAPYQTSDPPVCRSCYGLAVRHCPELGRGHVVLAPGSWAITGVRGQIADPAGGFGHPRTVDLPTASRPEQPELRLMLAKGLVASLYRARPVADPDSVSGLGARVQARLGV
jgi:hypothetical protein